MNIGILGTGSIARTMAAEFAKVPAFRCEAVCSRQQATGEALYESTKNILQDPEKRRSMAKAMAELGIPDATERIYNTLMALL